jgi:hypothetical protein
MGEWFKDHLRLVQAINEAHHGFKALLHSMHPEAPDVKTDAKPAPLEQSAELGIDNFVYVEPTTAVWKDAWHVTEGLIVEMRDEVRSKGARFVVATLSNDPQVLPNASQRDAFMKRFGVSDLFYPDNRIKALCNREGITVITLAPQLQAYAEQNKVFLHGFGQTLSYGHWNRDGHRVAGELIAQKLCTEAFAK